MHDIIEAHIKKHEQFIDIIQKFGNFIIKILLLLKKYISQVDSTNMQTHIRLLDISHYANDLVSDIEQAIVTVASKITNQMVNLYSLKCNTLYQQNSCLLLLQQYYDNLKLHYKKLLQGIIGSVDIKHEIESIYFRLNTIFDFPIQSYPFSLPRPYSTTEWVLKLYNLEQRILSALDQFNYQLFKEQMEKKYPLIKQEEAEDSKFNITNTTYESFKMDLENDDFNLINNDDEAYGYESFQSNETSIKPTFIQELNMWMSAIMNLLVNLIDDIDQEIEKDSSSWSTDQISNTTVKPKNKICNKILIILKDLKTQIDNLRQNISIILTNELFNELNVNCTFNSAELTDLIAQINKIVQVLQNTYIYNEVLEDNNILQTNSINTNVDNTLNAMQSYIKKFISIIQYAIRECIFQCISQIEKRDENIENINSMLSFLSHIDDYVLDDNIFTK